MLSKRINKWLVNFKKYLFFYRDGYYELPYISNSPAIMVASFKKMPFTKHNPAEQAIYTNNIFTDGVMHYRELEEGFWLLLTEMEFKKNVCTTALYDGEACDYYFLSHYRYTSAITHKVMNNVTVPAFGWGLYKPGTEMMAYFNAGAKGVFINFAFSTTWLSLNMPISQLPDENGIKKYLSSAELLVNWNDLVPDAAAQVQKMLHCLKNETIDAYSTLTLKMVCYNMLTGFFKSLDNEEIAPKDNRVNEADRKHLAKAEHMIAEALTTGFPGIAAIAKAVHMSPTKLKLLFKRFYGITMFQYYQQRQMQAAQEMLKQGSTVKEITLLLGYDNASNFIAAFKKYHGFLPSEV